MYNSFLEDFKGVWSKPNNALPQLIVINIVVFIALAILYVFSTILGFQGVYEFVNGQFSIPPRLEDFIFQPWTIITYAFNHSMPNLFHILFNMLVLYWFGRLIVEYLGTQKLVSLYVLGALAGGLLYLLAYNLIPYYINQSNFGGMIGASAAVYAITIAAATLIPDYTFHLVFLGPVKIKYIAGFYIVISFIGSVGGNAGGNVAHLGGAWLGYVYVRQLQSGNDLGAWINAILVFFKSFFTKQSKIKVTHKSTTKERSRSQSSRSTATKSEQEEIDSILDKISQSGYDSLSKEEKQKLFNASKK